MQRQLRAALVGLGLLGWTGGATAGTPAPHPAGPADGIFEGRYRCNAGLGGITLTIRSGSDKQLTAVLRFYSLPQNPRIPDGAYRLKGRYVPHARAVILNHRAWITRPPGYTAPDIRAVLS